MFSYFMGVPYKLIHRNGGWISEMKKMDEISITKKYNYFLMFMLFS